MWKCLTGGPDSSRLDLYPPCHEIVNYKEYLSNRNLISILYINLIYGRMGVLVCITALPALRWLSSQSTGWGGGLDLPSVQVNGLSHSTDPRLASNLSRRPGSVTVWRKNPGSLTELLFCDDPIGKEVNVPPPVTIGTISIRPADGSGTGTGVGSHGDAVRWFSHILNHPEPLPQVQTWRKPEETNC